MRKTGLIRDIVEDMLKSVIHRVDLILKLDTRMTTSDLEFRLDLPKTEK